MDNPASGQAPSIAQRAKAILINPASEWPRIATEDTSTREVATGYVIPLMLLGPVCGSIGTVLIGWNSFGYGPYATIYRPSLAGIVSGAAIAFVLTLISFYFLTILAHVLAPRFGATEGESRSFKLVAYSMTPALLVGALSIWPALAPLHLLALYGLYLLYAGASPMLGTPRDKAMSYTVVLVLCALVLNLVVAGLTAASMALFVDMGLLG